MDPQLLVRMYNIGLGDCIYLRVPDKKDTVHILIDCGNKFGSLDLLEASIDHLKNDLPALPNGKKRLDLLVVSHPHEDHHKGFEERIFKDIQIQRLWLSPAFNVVDPNAKGFHALQAAAQRALNALSLVALGEMKDQISELMALSTPQAVQALCHSIPAGNGIQPLFVTASTPAAKLRVFKDTAIKLRVLSPQADIDGYYLGGEGLPPTGNSLAEGYQSLLPGTAAGPATAQQKNGGGTGTGIPRNISAQDFALLQGGMASNALALAKLAGDIANNLSVVLLLEWKGQRLLFTGDAEWDSARNGAVEKGRSNGSWNVMWQERKSFLSKPLTFLKVGHHGSENATPWSPRPHPINAVLDSILPLREAGKKPAARAIVSTRRTARWPTIPNAPLLQELARRVANTSTAYDDGGSPLAVPPGAAQPQRTDMEELLAGHSVPFLELCFDPKP